MQGFGKSYTLGVIAEMATRAVGGINVLPAPLATVIFHYHKSDAYAPEFATAIAPNHKPREVEILARDYGFKVTLLRNAEPLYQWDLGAMTGPNEFQPRITPIPFAPGDSIVLDVRCDGTGLPTSTVCDVAVLLGGLQFPAG